jgi:hypothetical protein
LHLGPAADDDAGRGRWTCRTTSSIRAAAAT